MQVKWYFIGWFSVFCTEASTSVLLRLLNKCFSEGSLHSSLFFTVLEAGNPRLKCQQILVLVNTIFLFVDGYPLLWLIIPHMAKRDSVFFPFLIKVLIPSQGLHLQDLILSQLPLKRP
jgi:hypothetical protein